MYRELVQARQQQLEDSGVGRNYAAEIAHLMARQDRARTGKVVIKPSDREWEEGSMGRALFYIHELYDDTAVQDWWVFVHDIHSQSGIHRHQGGLALFVLEGEGATTVDGKRYDWKKGDLVLLPVKPGAVEHQHFNFTPDGTAKWLAFIYVPVLDAVASELTHLQDRQEWVEMRQQTQT